MKMTTGMPKISIGLIDGPIAIDNPALADQAILQVSGGLNGICAVTNSVACQHGTFVAGILCAKRESTAPSICPNCTLMVRSIFVETNNEYISLPSTTPTELATAIVGCVEAGAQILNLSVDLRQPSRKEQQELEEILNYAARRGVVVVAAAGNEGTLVSSVLTRHPWVIAVVAYDQRRKPMNLSNMAHSIGNRGLGAPGEKISSLGTTTPTYVLSGTSAATPFVTGTIALLWSLFPSATAGELRQAVTQSSSRRRTAVIPPLLDAWSAYQTMRAAYG